MKSLIRWVFEKLPILNLLDGKKRYIGFCMWLLSYVILGVAGALEFFPGVEFLATAHQALTTVYAQIGQFLHDVGLGTMVIGIGADAAKKQ